MSCAEKLFFSPSRFSCAMVPRRRRKEFLSFSHWPPRERGRIVDLFSSRFTLNDESRPHSCLRRRPPPFTLINGYFIDLFWWENNRACQWKSCFSSWSLDIEQENRRRRRKHPRARTENNKPKWVSLFRSRGVNALVLSGQEDNAETIRIVHKRKEKEKHNKVQGIFIFLVRLIDRQTMNVVNICAIGSNGLEKVDVLLDEQD